MGWTYCGCAGKHKPGCPNSRPGGFPPLDDDEDREEGGR
jgi:hypothetical protein